MLDLGPTNCSSLGKLNTIQATPIEIVCFVVLADEMVPESYFLKIMLANSTVVINYDVDYFCRVWL